MPAFASKMDGNCVKLMTPKRLKVPNNSHILASVTIHKTKYNVTQGERKIQTQEIQTLVCFNK